MMCEDALSVCVGALATGFGSIVVAFVALMKSYRTEKKVNNGHKN